MNNPITAQDLDGYQNTLCDVESNSFALENFWNDLFERQGCNCWEIDDPRYEEHEKKREILQSLLDYMNAKHTLSVLHKQLTDAGFDPNEL